MNSAGEALALVHAGDFAVAFRDIARLRDVCRDLSERVDPALAGLAARVADLISTDEKNGVEHWAALASAVRRSRGLRRRSKLPSAPGPRCDRAPRGAPLAAVGG